jgi:hypothetical protein
MLRDKLSGDRECKIAKVLHQRAQGPPTRHQAQVAEGLFGALPSTVHRLRAVRDRDGAEAQCLGVTHHAGYKTGLVDPIRTQT